MPRLDPSPEALLEFVGGVARARSVDELQTRYLVGISDFIGGFAAGMYVLNPFRSAGDSFAADSFAAYGVSDFFLSRYEETGRTRDPVLAHAVAEQCAVDNRSLMSAARWRSLPVYEEIFQLHHGFGRSRWRVRARQPCGSMTGSASKRPRSCRTSIPV